MRYRSLEAHLVANLTPDILVSPGPRIPEYPRRMVVLTPVSGPGRQTDGLTEVVGWQARSVGEQRDYNSAEDLAWRIDDLFNAMNGTTTVENVRVISGYRLGSPPTLLMVDDAERHHFVCSYLLSVYSSVAAQ